jgi:hypothetical protein
MFWGILLKLVCNTSKFVLSRLFLLLMFPQSLCVAFASRPFHGNFNVSFCSIAVSSEAVTAPSHGFISPTWRRKKVLLDGELIM